jgi:AAT family amino acid transporter
VIAGVTLLNLLGARQVSRLETSLASVKLFAVLAFIGTAAALIFGWCPAGPRWGWAAGR